MFVSLSPLQIDILTTVSKADQYCCQPLTFLTSGSRKQRRQALKELCSRGLIVRNEHGYSLSQAGQIICRTRL